MRSGGSERITRWMSEDSRITTEVSSSVSAVAERVSPPNMASSPKNAPVRNSASVRLRPEPLAWSRLMITAPLRTT